MRATTVLATLVAISALFPAEADKGKIADLLRAAAREAGCKEPVVEMMLTDPDDLLHLVVRCKDVPE